MTSDKQARVSRANERTEASKDLSPAQRLEKLDTKFGKGVGATKERTRLTSLLGKKVVKKESDDVNDLATATIPDEQMAEIEAMNNSQSKKKMRATKKGS